MLEIYQYDRSFTAIIQIRLSLTIAIFFIQFRDLALPLMLSYNIKIQVCQYLGIVMIRIFELLGCLLILASVNSQLTTAEYGQLGITEIWVDAINQAVAISDEFLKVEKAEFLEDAIMEKRSVKTTDEDNLLIFLEYSRTNYGIKYKVLVEFSVIFWAPTRILNFIWMTSIQDLLEFVQNN